MSKDARQKLRDMGGIMASSPDLMQAVQKFNNGGPIMPPAPPAMRRPMMPFPLRDPILTDDYFFTSFRRGELPRQSGPDALPAVNSDVSLRGDVMNSPELRRQVLAASAPSFGSSQTVSSVDREPQPDPILELAEASEGSRARALEIENMRKKGVKAAADFVMSLPDPVQSLSKYADIFGSELAGTIASFIGATDTGAKFFDVAKEQRREDFGLPVEDMTSPMGGPRRGRPQSAAERRLDTTDDQRAAATRDALSNIANIEDDTTPVIEDDTAPAPDETLPPMITNDPEGTATEALSSLDKSYEEKLALFQKVFGDGDEDKSRDRAMSLAMIGLAIAAGQSPNALTNIAQGAMVGLNAMGEQRKERQAKKERVKVMALDAALKEHQAQQEFARELGLKVLEAGDKSNYDKLVEEDTPFGKVRMYVPTAEAIDRGITPKLASDPNTVDAKYKQAIKERDRVYGFIDEASYLLEEGDAIAGGSGAFARAMGKLKNLLPESVVNAMPGQKNGLADYSRYDIIMNNLASELAPILLGESGRTISDGDRALVARQLGFAVDQNSVDGYDGITITSYVGTGIKSEEALKNSLDTIRERLDSHYGGLDESYSILRPGEYAKIIKQREKQKPQQIDGDALIEKWSS